MSEQLSQSQEEKTNLTSIAYNKIKTAIMHNRLKPGYPISGNQLSKQLHMSRTPIREAIQILASEGLVDTQKGVGFCVKGITLEELREITEVRAALECTALKTSIHTLPDADLADLMNRWHAAKELGRSSMKECICQIMELDTLTHNLIARNCNNRYLIRLLERIELRVTRIQYLSVDEENAFDTINQHLVILETVRARDVEAAVSLLEKHIYFCLAYITANLNTLSNQDLSGPTFWDYIFQD